MLFSPRKVLALVMLLCLALASPNARADTMALPDVATLVREADVIAVVQLSAKRSETLNPEVRKERFGYAAPVRVIEVLKGELPEEIRVHHGSARGNHLFQQGPGDYLVFLHRAGPLYVPAAAWASSKQIRDGMVAGWNRGHRIDEGSVAKARVLEEIRAVLAP